MILKNVLDKTNEKLNVLKTIKEEINYLKKQNFENVQVFNLMKLRNKIRNFNIIKMCF